MVRGCKGDMAPSLDLCPLAFFQHCWIILWSDVMGVGAEF